MSVMVKRRLLTGVVILMLIGATTIVSRPPAHGVRGTTTIVELQPANLRKGQCYVVTDADTASDCTTGGDDDMIVNICCSDGATWEAVGDGAGAGSYSFNVDGDTGPIQTLIDTETLLILGSAVSGKEGIDTVAEATDTIRIEFDTTEINDRTWGDNSEATITWTFDSNTADDPIVEFTDDHINITANMLIFASSAADTALVVAEATAGSATTVFEVVNDAFVPMFSVNFNGDTQSRFNFTSAGSITSMNTLSNNIISQPLGAETIGAGGTITANTCGGLKGISAAGPVTTDTTNTFTAPAAANDGCIIEVCNESANIITLDNNPNFIPTSGAPVPLSQNECITVGSNGVVWLELNQPSGTGVSNTTVRELLPSTDWVIPETGGAQEVVFGAGGNFPRTFLNFNDESADESIYLETHLPTGYRVGDAFTATVAWSTTATTGSNPGEQACWCLAAVDIAAGQGIDIAADETVCSDSSPTATANQRRTTLITLTQGSYTGGRALVLRLFRDEDSGDSNCEGAELTVDVRFHGLLLTYGLDL